MNTTIASAFALFAALIVAQPAAAQVKMGDNNRITQTGVIKGAQIATAVGVASVAMNGNASIMSGSSVTMGNNNRITQNGQLTGAQIATAVGLGATALNGNASIMAAR